MEIILGMLLGALLGGATIYFLINTNNKPEQQNPTSNSSRNLILKLIQSLPDIVIWVDGDNKIKYASEVALNLNIAREDKSGQAGTTHLHPKGTGIYTRWLRFT